MSQELKYTSEDISQIWERLQAAKNELECLNSKDSEKKKETVERIRDSVIILVEAKSISIKKEQVMNYVTNILVERGVSYSKGHLSELFTEDLKRNYSKSSLEHS